MIIVIQKWLKKDKGILSHNHAEKCMKVPFVAYADTESSLEKIEIITTRKNRSHQLQLFIIYILFI